MPKKLKLADILKLNAESQIQNMPPSEVQNPVDFMASLREYTDFGVSLLDKFGVKDMFIAKAREQLAKKLKLPTTQSTVSSQQSPTLPITHNSSPITSLSSEFIFNHVIGFLNSFITKNGDMPLSQFKSGIEESKKQIIEYINEMLKS